MNAKQLYENAALDAFGLLDRREVELFEQALASAPATLRMSIASLQDRLLRVDLPGLDSSADEPPADLRERVLSAVEGEIAVAALSANATGSFNFGAAAQAQPSRRVHQWWRAAALGGIAAALVLSTTTLVLRNAFYEVDAAIKNNDALKVVGGFGDGFESALLDPTCRFVQFTRVDAKPETKSDVKLDAKAVAKVPARAGAVLLMADGGAAHLIARDLATETARFSIVGLNEDGTTTTLAQITGPRVAMKIPASLLKGAKALAIVPAGRGEEEAILRSTGSSLAGVVPADGEQRLAMLMSAADLLK